METRKTTKETASASSEAVKNVHGYMAYWFAASQTCPIVAKMAMDFVSTPGDLFLALSLVPFIYFF